MNIIYQAKMNATPWKSTALRLHWCLKQPIQQHITALPSLIRHLSIKVVLLEGDESRGWLKGQEVTVKRGFARNYLIPKKQAVYATKENIEKFKTVSDEDAPQKVTRHTKQALKRQGRMQAVVDALYKGVPPGAGGHNDQQHPVLHMKRHSDDGSTLHAPVTTFNIRDKIKKFFKVDIDPSDIKLPNNEILTKYGDHRVALNLDTGTSEEHILTVRLRKR
mmetsp:Transcript_22988/g.33349  ORF Transcript_22988/g.33349 Transcript_22988/m.33349 type:complete len:220 (-) Transcript_22988:33-692(-)